MTIVVDIVDEDALTREFERIRKILKTLRKNEVLRLEWGTKWAFKQLEEQEPAERFLQKVRSAPKGFPKEFGYLAYGFMKALEVAVEDC